MIEFNMILPTSVVLRKKKYKKQNVVLNLNTYRNTHHLKLNDMKKDYARSLLPEIMKVKLEINRLMVELKNATKWYELTYTITSKDKKKFDISNHCSIIDKFTCDAIVKHGFMKDDSFEHLKRVNYVFGGVTGERTCTLNLKIHINNMNNNEIEQQR